MKSEIIKYAKSIHRDGLGVGTSGNISCRVKDVDKSVTKGFLITPSATPYDLLEDVVECDMGNKSSGNPSSEYPLHQVIYEKTLWDAIVHVHSPYATAIACRGQGIPDFYSMVGHINGGAIPCAPWACPGTAALGESVVSVMKGKACLMEQHGVVTVGHSVQDAYETAIEIEEIARIYILYENITNPDR